MSDYTSCLVCKGGVPCCGGLFHDFDPTIRACTHCGSDERSHYALVDLSDHVRSIFETTGFEPNTVLMGGKVFQNFQTIAEQYQPGGYIADRVFPVIKVQDRMSSALKSITGTFERLNEQLNPPATPQGEVVRPQIGDMVSINGCYVGVVESVRADGQVKIRSNGGGAGVAAQVSHEKMRSPEVMETWELLRDWRGNS